MSNELENRTINSNKRTLIYKDKQEGRYWWYQGKNYVPPLYSFLTDEEWNLIEEWYRETDESNRTGESNVPILSIIQGFIMGSNISHIVQLGHNSGYSTLLIGFMLRKMNSKNSFITIDIDKTACDVTQKWVDKAKLTEYVRIENGDSADSKFPILTKDFFSDGPKLIFIDSSHQYEHTLMELDLWYESLQKGGIIILHDSSDFASSYDFTGKGGVTKAYEEWVSNKQDVHYINLNKTAYMDLSKYIYLDACGLGIIQKDFHAEAGITKSDLEPCVEEIQKLQHKLESFQEELSLYKKNSEKLKNEKQQLQSDLEATGSSLKIMIESEKALRYELKLMRDEMSTPSYKLYKRLRSNVLFRLAYKLSFKPFLK